ncbi:hypothetical protein [Paraburkholderia kururiensis]|uniref:hypothetical protein n=1 Tax=Paraburkholderia kururiensis TaxID=984307 RepID=UPI0005A88FAA|nr:hypothetical protein [Paraburkholderia kururiensis]
MRKSARDPWAHVVPSTFTWKPHYEAYQSDSGNRRWLHSGTMFEHPTLNGGTHCVWEWSDGEAFEFWRDSNGRVVAGPRVTQRELHGR